MSAELQPFIERCTESGLLTAADMRQFVDSLPPKNRPQSEEDLARELVRAGKLTKYQAAAIFQGKGRNLALGDYIILDKIGAGGMGQVFKARHQRMKRLVALKLLSAAHAKHPEAIKRFEREVEAAARLSHPNIVAAHDAGAARGVHYLVMEYVDGRDLSEILQERGPLPMREALGYILQAAQGLAFAHGMGVVHRDIKPANVLVDKRGVVKILDMGLARFDQPPNGDDQLTASGMMMGTVDFMAPEQATDTHRADARSDIYSLGCTLYKLVTGENIYHAESMVKKVVAHMQAPIPALAAKQAEVPSAVDAVYQKMVAKKPADRYQRVEELIADLEACRAAMDDETVAELALPSSASGLTNFTAMLRQPAAVPNVPAPPIQQQVAVQQPAAAPPPLVTARRVSEAGDTDRKAQPTIPSESPFTPSPPVKQSLDAPRPSGNGLLIVGAVLVAAGATIALLFAVVFGAKMVLWPAKVSPPLARAKPDKSVGVPAKAPAKPAGSLGPAPTSPPAKPAEKSPPVESPPPPPPPTAAAPVALPPERPLEQMELWYAAPDLKILARHFKSDLTTHLKMPAGRLVDVQWIAGGKTLAAVIGNQWWELDTDAPDTWRKVRTFDVAPQAVAISPNGRRAAWCKPISGQAPEFIVIDREGSQRISLGQAYDPFWFDDGQRLAYTGTSVGKWAIGIWDGSKSQFIVVPVHPTVSLYPAVSPDGTAMAYDMLGADGTRQIGVVGIADKQVRQVTRNGKFNIFPTYSPDGRHLAFLRTGDNRSGNKTDLFIIDLQTEEETRLAADVAFVRPTWRRTADDAGPLGELWPLPPLSVGK